MEGNLGFHCHRLSQVDERIVANGLRRGEFYHFPPDELDALKRKIKDHDLSMSIHCPLVKPPWYPEPPTLAFLCDVDAEKRQLNLKMITETLEVARDFEAEYVVVHFPSPSFTDPGETSHSEMCDILWDSAERLARLSEEYEVPVHIEGFGPTPFLDGRFIAGMLRTLPCLGYCYDTGHMNMAAQRDGIDNSEFIDQVAPSIASVHVWNNRGLEDYSRYRHIPVHPSQHPGEGWADIEAILSRIVKDKPSVPVILESGTSYPFALGGYDYRDGVEWVRRLLRTSS